MPLRLGESESAIMERRPDRKSRTYLCAVWVWGSESAWVWCEGAKRVSEPRERKGWMEARGVPGIEHFAYTNNTLYNKQVRALSLRQFFSFTHTHIAHTSPPLL